MNNPCSEPFITYVVYAKHTDRDILLGIATGTIEDIEAFYYSQRGGRKGSKSSRCDFNTFLPG